MSIQIRFIEFFGRQGESDAVIQTYASIEDLLAAVPFEEPFHDIHAEVAKRARDGIVYATKDGYDEDIRAPGLFMAHSYNEVARLSDRPH